MHTLFSLVWIKPCKWCMPFLYTCSINNQAIKFLLSLRMQPKQCQQNVVYHVFIANKYNTIKYIIYYRRFYDLIINIGLCCLLVKLCMWHHMVLWQSSNALAVIFLSKEYRKNISDRNNCLSKTPTIMSNKYNTTTLATFYLVTNIHNSFHCHSYCRSQVFFGSHFRFTKIGVGVCTCKFARSFSHLQSFN